MQKLGNKTLENKQKEGHGYMKEFDYSSYGKMKSLSGRFGNQKAILRKLGLKNRYIRYLTNIPKNAAIVELGCGDGSFINDLLAAGYKNIRGVEPSTTYNFVAEHKLIYSDFAMPFLEKCEEESIDLIIAMDVFEHIPQNELKILLTLIKSRLKPEGILIFRVPNMASAFGLINYFGDLSHTTPFTESSVHQLAFNCGLKLEAVYSEPFSYPRSLYAIIGIIIWPFFAIVYRSLLAAFGINTKNLSPNIICKMTKSPQKEN